MKKIMIAIFDKKAGYDQPILLPNEGVAIRSFGEQCQNKDPNNMLIKHPEDFELHNLGIMDTMTGQILPNTQPVCIAKASQYVTKEE